MKKRLNLHINFKSLLRPDIKAVKSIMKVGLPAAGDSISYTCMQMVVLSLINTFGTMAVTTKVYLGSLLPFVYIFASSVATATQISVGYMVGKKETDKATRLVLKATVLAITVSLTLSIILLIGSDKIFGVFTKDAAILSLIKKVLIVDLFLEIGRTVNLMIIRALLGAGDTAFSLYCALTSMWFVAVPLSFLLGSYFGMGLAGVWIALAADEWFRAFAFLFRWKSGKWKTKKLI